MKIRALKEKIRQSVPYLQKIYGKIEALDAQVAAEREKVASLEALLASQKQNAAPVRSGAILSEKDGYLTERLLNHPVSGAFPEVRLAHRPAKPQPNRIDNASRLLKAYDRALNDPNSHKYMPRDASGNMWNEISNTGLRDLIQVVESGKAELLAQYLEEFGNSFVWFGGVTTCIDGYNGNLDSRHVALTYWDSLVRVSEYLGLRRVENPESGPWGEALYLDQEAVVKDIEDHLGISIAAPLEIIHTDGLQVGNSLVHYRHTNSLYSAIRLQQISKLVGPSPKIVEIGGGIGLASLYSNRLGLKNYTLLDIPITNLLSANYLLNALGPDKVGLFGEDHGNSEIHVLPFWTCTERDANSFDICLNQDSINELDDGARSFYRDEIPRLTSGYFLSINHECFFPKTAFKLFSDSKALALVSRGPYWTRSGYIEELYKVLN